MQIAASGATRAWVPTRPASSHSRVLSRRSRKSNALSSSDEIYEQLVRAANPSRLDTKQTHNTALHVARPEAFIPRPSCLRLRLTQARLVDKAILAATDRTRHADRPRSQQKSSALSKASTRPSTAPTHAYSVVQQRRAVRTRTKLDPRVELAIPWVDSVSSPLPGAAASLPDATTSLPGATTLLPNTITSLPGATTSLPDYTAPHPDTTEPSLATVSDRLTFMCNSLTSGRQPEVAAEEKAEVVHVLADVLRIVLAQETDQTALLSLSASLPKVTRWWKGSQLMQHAPWSSTNLLQLVFGPDAWRLGTGVQRCVQVLRAAGPAAASMSGALRVWWPELYHEKLGSRRFFLLGLKHQQFYETGFYETGLRIWPFNFIFLQFLWSNPELVAGRVCLELGAGVGVLSVAAMVLEPSLYVATEVSPRCRKLMAINMAMNSCSPDLVLVSSLKFGRRDAQNFVQGQQSHLFGFHSTRPLPTGKYSTILGCEIVYEDDVVRPLWAAIKELLAESRDSVFVLGYYLRSRPLQEELLAQAVASGFCWDEVPRKQYLPIDGSNDFMKTTLQITSDEEWSASFMNNWNASHFHIYLFRWAHLK